MKKGKKIFRLIWNINGVLLLSMFCILAFILAMKFIESLGPRSHQGVTLVKPTEIKSKPIEYQIYDVPDVIKDCFIFQVKSNALLLTVDRDAAGMMGVPPPLREAATVNLVFISASNSKPKRLFPENVFILRYNLADFNENNGRKPFSKNLYLVVVADTNKNGQLDQNDNQDLYISNYDGSEFKKVKTKVNYFEVLNEKQLLVSFLVKHKIVFEIYDIESGRLNQLLNQNDLKLD